jgi:O-antigen/teichoic acid export membrane protein
MSLASLLSFFKLIVFGKFLEPSSLGYYSIVLTISSYGAFLQFGLMSGFNRELPIAFGKGKSTYSSNLVGVTTWVLLHIFCIFSIIKPVIPICFINKLFC